MKANELMIGDWVYNKNIDKPMQIYPMIFSQMFRINPNASIEDYNIFPIPLTPEILEKIRFKREGGASYWHEGDRDACILHWSEDKKELVIGSPCDDCMVKMNVRYVHELQHAFRLAGIDKDIKVED